VAAERFRPAALLLDPRQFGRVETLTAWSPVQVFRPEVVAAAMLQHMSAFEVRRELGLIPEFPPDKRRTPAKTPVRSLEDLASAMGESLRTLERKLNGQAAASIQDLAGWAYHLDHPMVWPCVGNREDLKRPGDKWVSLSERRTSTRLPTKSDDQDVLPDE
jgi:hypothetical protein